jgi:hypothetical protein
VFGHKLVWGMKLLKTRLLTAVSAGGMFVLWYVVTELPVAKQPERSLP